MTETYYLYIWLDKEETNSNTMNQNFSLSLTGSCTNDPDVEPQKPELDPGMIPVTISNTGVVTTISEDDEDWYDYSNKEWANVVLVNEEATSGVTGSKSREYYKNNPGKTVLASDILAYYVWVPRYKYRIRENVISCLELENPTVENNSECYSYALLDSNSDGSTADEKELFIEYWYNNESDWLLEDYGVTYTMEEATKDVETMLNTGEVIVDEPYYTYFLQEQIRYYNEENDPDITYTATISISESDKELLIDWFQEDYGSFLEAEYSYNYTSEEATEDVEIMLNTGSVYNEIDNVTIYFDDVIFTYNVENDPDITYTATISISESDKELFINWWYEWEWGSDNDLGYTLESAREDINNALNTGRIIVDEPYDKYTFTEVLGWYNDENDLYIMYTSIFNGNNNTVDNIPRTIDISFEPKVAQVTRGDAVNTYYTHPAFIWDGETIGGLWVGKFETSTNSSSTCYTSASKDNCNNINQEPRILPNVKSLGYQTISNQFQTALKFSGGIFDTSTGIVTFSDNNTYGLSNTTDSHMMKNSEWGAVAYLSHSKYGINYEIRMNNNSNRITGCGASEENGNVTTECQITYGMVSDGVYPQSTTGNITGIFDMSGGTPEYVMVNYGDVKFASEFPIFPESKYYDWYSSFDFNAGYTKNMSLCTLETCGGHALHETALWYDAYGWFVAPDLSWFVRGGGYYDGARTGVFSSGVSSTGGGGEDEGFRSLAIVNG